MSLPAALRGLKNATLFFIERLEPYRYTIGAPQCMILKTKSIPVIEITCPQTNESELIPRTGPKGSAGLQGAQVSADALNKAWTVTPAGTRLTKRYPVTHPLAKRTRLEVATVFMTQCLSLRSYITSFLNDHEISPFSQETMVLCEYASLSLSGNAERSSQSEGATIRSWYLASNFSCREKKRTSNDSLQTFSNFQRNTRGSSSVPRSCVPSPRKESSVK